MRFEPTNREEVIVRLTLGEARAEFARAVKEGRMGDATELARVIRQTEAEAAARG